MKSKLFKKLFIGVTVIIIFSGCLAVFFGHYLVRQYFFEMKLGELEPQTKVFAAQFGQADRLPDEIDAKSLMIEAVVKIYDLNKQQIVKFAGPEIAGFGEDRIDFDKIDKPLSPFIDTVLSGSSVKEITELAEMPGAYILIGEPIINNSKIIGAYFSIKPVEEYSSSLQGVYFSLILSLGIALLLILILIYFFSKKLFKPLSKINSSSLAMAKGDYSIRVDESQKDEIGELATSINFLAKALEENEAAAKQLEQTRRDYIANVSHELRTPVSAIRAFSETLNDRMITDEVQKEKYYGMMLRESIRLEKLINDMLDLSRLQSGNAAVKKSSIDVAAILKNITADYKIIADDIDVAFTWNIDFESVPSAFSNADRITQLLIILLDNAFKYTPSGGIVTLNADWNNDIINIHIADTGEGIAKEDIPFVFERFYQGDKSHASKGTGLGLSIAKEIVLRLDEEIHVESIQGKGSVFSFTLHRN